MPPDPLADAAALIRDVGQSAQRARRYRALAVALAEPIFDRALAIGSEIRRAARGSDPRPAEAIAEAIAELRDLLARCNESIAGVQASPTYREAVESFALGSAARVAALATSLFTDVSSCAPTGLLYWAVPISSGQTGSHFLPAGELAGRLKAIAAGGIIAPRQAPELGGDENITPVLLTEEHDGSESPIALAYDPHALTGPVSHLDGSNIALFYAARLTGAFTVHCLATVTDEWWNVRPDAYREYLQDLQTALRTAGLRAVVES
jgi:hypothetical protein